jgi:hypothetical protein
MGRTRVASTLSNTSLPANATARATSAADVTGEEAGLDVSRAI